jgi:hypothetical protein
LRLAQELVEELGVDAGDQRVSIPYSTRAMAQHLHRSAGTIAAQLRQLDELGVRVAAKPVTVIDVSRLRHALGIETPTPPASTVTSALLFARVLDIVERNPETASAMSVFADAIARTHVPVPREEPASNVAVPRGNEQSVRDDSRTRAVLPRKARKQDLPPAVTTRTLTDVAALCAPVEAAAQRLELPATNHGQGLLDALAGYTDEQVGAAVQRLVRELTSDQSNIRNPISVLITRASRSPEFFAPLPVTTSPSTATVELVLPLALTIYEQTGDVDEVRRYLTTRGHHSELVDEVVTTIIASSESNEVAA